MQTCGGRLSVALCAVLSVTLLGGALWVSPAQAYKDRALEMVPPLEYGPNSDPCYGNPEGTVTWKECESTAAWPQWHKWKEGKATNEYNTLGKVIVGVTEGETLGLWHMYASAEGRFGTWAFSNEFSHSYWPDLGVVKWWPFECLEAHGSWPCLWESVLIFYGA